MRFNYFLLKIKRGHSIIKIAPNFYKFGANYNSMKLNSAYSHKSFMLLNHQLNKFFPLPFTAFKNLNIFRLFQKTLYFVVVPNDVIISNIFFQIGKPFFFL